MSHVKETVCSSLDMRHGLCVPQMLPLVRPVRMGFSVHMQQTQAFFPPYIARLHPEGRAVCAKRKSEVVCVVLPTSVWRSFKSGVGYT